MVTCPKCLGSKEIFIHNKLKECNLCEGKWEVSNTLEEDFIQSIHIFEDD